LASSLVHHEEYDEVRLKHQDSALIRMAIFYLIRHAHLSDALQQALGDAVSELPNREHLLDHGWNHVRGNYGSELKIEN
jgi:hypothetical protein